jgi:hypothetical protein
LLQELSAVVSDPGSISGSVNQGVAISINAFAADATPSTTQDQATQAPQCYNGDDGKFYKVGEKATISGVPLVCEATADKKNAQWIGVKHTK